MNRFLAYIIKLFISGIRKGGRFLANRLLYFIFYIRMLSFKLKHSIFVRPKKITILLSRVLKAIKEKKSNKAFFLWNLTKPVTQIRVIIVTIGFALIFLVVTIRLIIISSSENVKYANSNEKKMSKRLDIVDRNNKFLAVNLPGASLYANPFRIIDSNLAVKKLHSVIPELNYKDTLNKLKSSKKFTWIKRNITPQEYEKIYNLGLDGFGFEIEQTRIYIYENLLSHVIGYVGRDFNGLAGIEKYFNKFLTGQLEKEPKGNWNSSLQLSIDVRVQNILSEEIEKTMIKFSAKGGAGIVADPNNGEILALISKPDFNPHNPAIAKTNQLFNMATQGVYEMGSGIKSLTMAIGIDSGATSMRDAYDLTYMKVREKVLRDAHPMKGWYTVPHIFLKSSNVGVAQIILEIGKDTLANYLGNLGLLEQLQIELPERGNPLFPSFSKWTDLSLITMSYGYAVSESPAHFVQAMIPAINGGVLYPLTLLKQDPNAPIVGKRVFKENTSDDMRKLMHLVVKYGTASKAKVKGYFVGGKTGTAEIVHAGKYDKNKKVSSFLGIVPASNPKYMVYIVYNEPKGLKETYGFAGGGWTATSTAGAVFARIATLFCIKKLDENSPEIRELTNIEYKIQNET